MRVRIADHLGAAMMAFALAALLGSAPASAVSKDVPNRGADDFASEERSPIALGVSMPDGRDMKELDAFTKSIGGRKPAVWSIWSHWGKASTRDFPTKAADRVRSRGATPMIWWTPYTPGAPSDPTYARLANIVAGDHDVYIREFARAAKRYRHTVLLRFAHEANGSHLPWTVAKFDNSVETFVAAWRHVHDIFREVRARNVKFVWSVAKQSCTGGCNPYVAFYPGDDYVDYMGFSSFNWGDQRDRWASMLTGFDRVTRHLGEISSKPIIAAEVACNPEGGDKAAWIAEGYPAVYAALPQIVAIVYLNVDLRPIGHPDWRLSSPPAALEAYAQIAARPEFRGRL